MAGSLRIAVIADTHDRLPPFLLEAIREADEIWHLGDVCEQGTLKTIQDLGPRVFVVRGNQDNQPDWPMSLELERFGHRFHLVHIPPRHAPAGTEFLLHGHTHVRCDERSGRTRIVNPGAFVRVERATVALITPALDRVEFLDVP